MGKNDWILPVVAVGGLAVVAASLFLFPQGREILRDIERAYFKSIGGTPVPGIDIPPYTYKP